jgi:hypothetical protein
MRVEIREAIDSAGSVGSARLFGGPLRRMSFDRVRAIVLAVVRELPDDMSVAELRDELEIAENQ